MGSDGARSAIDVGGSSTGGRDLVTRAVRRALQVRLVCRTIAEGFVIGIVMSAVEVLGNLEET